jgi:hypothetical protein
LAEDQAQGLYSFDERDLSMEMEKLHVHIPGGEDECAVEAEQPSQSVREISDALVDLDTFPIQDIPLQPRSPKDVLTVFSLILEWLRDEHASGDCSQV